VGTRTAGGQDDRRADRSNPRADRSRPSSETAHGSHAA
jgi:hypothetical protein